MKEPKTERGRDHRQLFRHFYSFKPDVAEVGKGVHFKNYYCQGEVGEGGEEVQFSVKF